MNLDRPVGIVGQPSADASWTYRLLLLAIRGLGRGVFGFHTEVLGAELLPRDASGSPAGGWIAAGLPHRTWVDPFIVADNLPIELRLVFFGDGRAMFRSRWRGSVFRRIGGVIPIWPGGGRASIDAHLSAASQALAAGAVLCLFPRRGRRPRPGPPDHWVSGSPTSRCVLAPLSSRSCWAAPTSSIVAVVSGCRSCPLCQPVSWRALPPRRRCRSPGRPLSARWHIGSWRHSTLGPSMRSQTPIAPRNCRWAQGSAGDG